MGGEPRQLHVALFPFMAAGHTIPFIHIASLFAARNVKTTILSTPLNAPNITKLLCNQQNIDIEIILFPFEEAGLPKGIENMANVPPQMAFQFMSSMRFFKETLEEFLEKKRPDCLVADAFFPFATDVAAKFKIPRLVFHGNGFFTTCVPLALKKYKPHKDFWLDNEPFVVVPHLPHEVKLAKSEFPPTERKNNGQENDYEKLFAATEEAELKSFGVIFNSFYELEPEYVEYYRKVLGRRAWHIGPVSQCNNRRDNEDENEVECLKWLNLKEPNSVIYVCFGSLAMFLASQLKEIAMALEASGQHFIWVVNKGKQVEVESEVASMLEGLEKRTQERGLIIRGWAPQVMILRHQAIGGFMTHCGWNSIIESVSGGVPMATWPLFGDQFYSEKLVTDILKIGVQVGSEQRPLSINILKWDKLKATLDQLMVGEEALEMRSRANRLKEMAWKAMKEGGSSLSDLSTLIQELSCYRHSLCGESHSAN